jgi:hypothetical protein
MDKSGTYTFKGGGSPLALFGCMTALAEERNTVVPAGAVVAAYACNALWDYIYGSSYILDATLGQTEHDVSCVWLHHKHDDKIRGDAIIYIFVRPDNTNICVIGANDDVTRTEWRVPPSEVVDTVAMLLVMVG